MDKNLHPPFHQESDLGITMNYRGINPSAITAKVYNILLLNCIKPEVKKILWKNQCGFQEIDQQLYRF